MPDIKLSGFKLEPSEVDCVNKVINTYTKKINNLCLYDNLSIHLKKSKHGKTFLHRASISLKTKKDIFGTEIEGYNLYRILSEAMQKVLHEIEHFKRTRRQTAIKRC